MGRSWVLTQDKRIELINRYIGGEHVTPLAEEYGVSPAAVYSLLAYRKIPLRDPFPDRPSEDWLTIAEAATLIGLSKPGIKGRIKRGLLQVYAAPSGTRAPRRFYVLRSEVEASSSIDEPHYRAPYDRHHSVAQLAYLAGLIDGEGTVGVHKREGKAGNPYHYIALAISNTHEPLIQWLHETFGGHTNRRIQHVPHWKYCYAWTPNQQHAAHLLRLTLPFLRVKREQAEIALQVYEHIVQFKGTKWKNLTPEVVAWRDECRDRVMALNRRGRQPLED